MYLTEEGPVSGPSCLLANKNRLTLECWMPWLVAAYALDAVGSGIWVEFEGIVARHHGILGNFYARHSV
jgi:hypothetical protein